MTVMCSWTEVTGCLYRKGYCFGETKSSFVLVSGGFRSGPGWFGCANIPDSILRQNVGARARGELRVTDVAEHVSKGEQSTIHVSGS